jgi:hypothetical protein
MLNNALPWELPCGLGKTLGRSPGAEDRRRGALGEGCGNSGSGDRGARLDQHVARGALVTHKGGFMSLRGRGLRPEGGAHRRRQWRNGGGSGQMRVRVRRGQGWLISVREVGWGRWGHVGATCTRGEVGGMATSPLRLPMARHGRCAGRWISATWRGPLATDGTGVLPPMQRSDQRSLRRLGVHA